MYSIYVKENAIPLFLIYLHLIFDRPVYLEQSLTISYSQNQDFIYVFLLNATTNPSTISKIDPSHKIKLIKLEYKRYARDLYRNYGQNLMLNITL